MLFMGEEFAASTPFQYFCDFGPELAEAVSRGRREEFGRFAAFAAPEAQASIPDPNDEATFRASTLRWEEREQSPHREQLAHIRELLEVRHRLLVPHLHRQRGGGSFVCEGQTLRVRWPLVAGGGEKPEPASSALHLLAHFGADAAEAPAPPGRTLYGSGTSSALNGTLRLQRGAVHLTIEEARRG